MKSIKINYKNFIPSNFTGIAEYPDGHKEWYKKGKFHRLDGPAIEYLNGLKYWYKEDRFHRLNGPAIEHVNGDKEWRIENKLYSPKYLLHLFNSSFYLGKEKGQYNLEWLRFLTEEGIKEFPIIFGMKEDEKFKEVFNKLKGIKIK
jgi:hypothetical protein